MRLPSVKISLLLVVLVLGILSLTASQFTRAMVEKPRYEVLQKAKAYTIRRYPPCIAARVDIDGHEEEAMNQGFRPLADYIFGNNRAQSKVAMTSPVTQEAKTSQKIAMTTPVTQESHGGIQVVSFLMPSDYSLADLPRPNNDAVRLETLPEKTVAVLRFSWVGEDKQMRAKEAELREALARDGIEVVGTPIYARYDPPWTLPLFRRNEVMLPVKYEKDLAQAAGSR